MYWSREEQEISRFRPGVVHGLRCSPKRPCPLTLPLDEFIAAVVLQSEPLNVYSICLRTCISRDGVVSAVNTLRTGAGRNKRFHAFALV